MVLNCFVQTGINFNFQIREEEKTNRPDLYILATSYFGQLKSKAATFVRESDFHIVPAKEPKEPKEQKEFKEAKEVVVIEEEKQRSEKREGREKTERRGETKTKTTESPTTRLVDAVLSLSRLIVAHG